MLLEALKRISASTVEHKTASMCTLIESMSGPQQETLQSGFLGIEKWFSGDFMGKSFPDPIRLLISSTAPSIELTANAMLFVSKHLGVPLAPPKVLYRLHDLIGDTKFREFAQGIDPATGTIFRNVDRQIRNFDNRAWHRDKDNRHLVPTIKKAHESYCKLGTPVEFTTQKPLLSWTSDVATCLKSSSSQIRSKTPTDVVLAITGSSLRPVITNDPGVSKGVYRKAYKWIDANYNVNRGGQEDNIFRRLSVALYHVDNYADQKEWVLHHPNHSMVAYIFAANGKRLRSL